jgi:plasmid stabilization system protein ParE
MAAAGPAKRLEWAPRALDSFLATLTKVADEDPSAAQQLELRVAQALAVIQAHPAIGTPATRRGERRYPIPNTGHVINYRVVRQAIRVQLWYRARQHLVRR